MMELKRNLSASLQEKTRRLTCAVNNNKGVRRGAWHPRNIAAFCALCAVAAGVALYLFSAVPQAFDAPTPTSRALEAHLPSVLGADDIRRYREIFKRQKARDLAGADARLNTLEEPLLLGHVLAERYLSPAYKTSFAETRVWLARYADHPQAERIHRLATRKKPSSERLGAATAPRTLKGYSAGSFGTDRPAQWTLGLNAFRAGKKAEAAKYFATAVRTSDDDKPADVSAAAYWAYRSYQALGERAKAENYLEMAAAAPRTFYGILATKALGRDLELQMEPEALDQDTLDELMESPAIRRAVALYEIGQSALAEQELRRFFPRKDKETQQHLLALAAMLDLPALQIRMAQSLADGEHPYDFAFYPIPSWQPEEGFGIDPALIFAVARQESGFHLEAKSHAGARGLMQLMPGTARSMARRLRDPAASALALQSNSWKGLVSLSEPETNLTLGQSYLRYLMRQKHIGDNLFYLSAAYNAGPGKLAEWQRTLRYRNDPLLFLESIPYAETRRYVAQIMTNYWIYSEMISGEAASLSFLLDHDWPRYTMDASQAYAASTTLR